MHHDAGTPGVVVVATAIVLLGAAAYAVLAAREAVGPRGWSPWRVVAFLTGSAVLVAGLLVGHPSGWAPYPAHDLRTHMLGHLLVGMYAPLGLVLGAPVTLLLRSLPTRRARRLVRVLRSRPAVPLTHPVTGLVLTLGGLAALHLTPLHALAMREPAAAHLVTLHFLLAGCLFTHAVAGPDPAPHRPSVPSRLVVLGVAVAGHAVLSQLLYAGALGHVTAPAEQLRGAGTLMYYGGDVAELLLALALVSTWRPDPRRDRPGCTAGRRDHQPVG
ncbi:cytochrome c oxidase assembly protein [Nocardioides sp. CFH 31398]|uniref:cytochrome c oxidase assembly protein n=1 Tax=Nocardioides sp. CFH 31398 TaxID=2919579 RepID=UPI001F06BEA9|nr:cytochrome c oxidase assembly protein [Nocardioides sp. CFH 31398]MCH1866559.1 cytochrome c oxidase assembly protein [Nocardioides sp. CFH 31398]